MAQVVKTSVANNTPQDSNHPDDLFQSRYVWFQTIFLFIDRYITPGFKPFSYIKAQIIRSSLLVHLKKLVSHRIITECKFNFRLLLLLAAL